MQKKNNNIFVVKGQSLFEVVLAISLISLIMTSIVALSSMSIKNSNFSNTQNMATSKAQETLEWLRNVRDSDWDVFNYFWNNEILTKTWCVPVLLVDEIIAGECNSEDKIPDTVFQREVYFDTTEGIDYLIDVDVKIKWTDREGFHTVSAYTTFTDWRFQ